MRARTAFSVAAILSLCANAFAEEAALSGVVSDGDKSALPSVTVTAVDADGHDRLVVTGDDGVFRFSDLPAGIYSLAAELPGFGTVTVTGVQIADGRAVTIPLSLELVPIGYSLVATGIADGVDIAARHAKSRSKLRRQRNDPIAAIGTRPLVASSAVGGEFPVALRTPLKELALP